MLLDWEKAGHVEVLLLLIVMERGVKASVTEGAECRSQTSIMPGG